jgi:Virulence-associated protein E
MRDVGKEEGPGGASGAEVQGTTINLALGAEVIPGRAAPREGEGLLLGRTDDAEEFLERWRPGGPWVLTSIVPDGGKTTTRTFGASERLTMRDWVDERQGRENIYFSVNDLSRAVSKKAGKDDVAALRALHVDVDPRPGEPLDAERRRAEKLLREFNPTPTVIIDSGGGFQGFWLGEEPEVLPAPDTPEREGAVKDAELRNLKVETALQADACHNIDRIMRLPGTINVPNKKKLAKGRVPALARVVEADWSRRLVLDAFPRATAVASAVAPREAAPAVGVMVSDLPIPDKCKQVIVMGHDPDEPGRWDGATGPGGKWSGDRSKVVWWVTCEMVRAGCTDEVITGVLLDPDYAISSHVREQKGSERYARRQVAKAREEADSSFVCDKEGNPYRDSQHNIRVALRRLGVTLSHDLLAGRANVEGLDSYGPNLDDDVCNRLWMVIDEKFSFRPTWEFFNRFLTDHARQSAFHPIVDYLSGLTWDGKPRLGSWLAAYGGAETTDYTRAVGELVLVAAVRRVRRPGVKFDEMLVLESSQGTNKSTALKVLAGGDAWFTDDLPLNAEGKRVIEALSGKWIVEAGELKGMRKGGADHLKSFLSRTHDRGRLSYDRREREVPRQCVIIGTTNDSRYLRDTTGNRRFWPVKVEAFDIDALRRDRDQLWAEAAMREAEGAAIRLDPALWAEAAAEQDARRVEDPYFERLHGVLGEEVAGKLRAEDAWRIVGKPAGMRNQDDNERLGDVMRRLGFDRTKRRFGLPNPEWCYVRGDGVRRIVPKFDPHGELEGVALTDGEEWSP